MPTSRAAQPLAILRMVVAGLMLIHGVYRATTEGFVSGFGEFLTASGLPAGALLATMITGWELLGSLWLASGWRVTIPALVFAAELTVGMVMVHAPEGWFVVGGGRNGVEYSVLLITCMLVIAWAAGPREWPAPAEELPLE